MRHLMTSVTELRVLLDHPGALLSRQMNGLDLVWHMSQPRMVGRHRHNVAPIRGQLRPQPAPMLRE